jgi:DNA polymerase I-like protein with 3'-5' exonuclease and polymerase domains
MYYPAFNFATDMAVFSDLGQLQMLAKDLAGRNPRASYDRCATCPALATCVYEIERGYKQSLVNEAKRQAVNSIVQSAASDMAGKAFSRVLLTCRQHGIPITVDDDVPGITPWNIVHDELLYRVSDQYVEAVKQIMHDVMTGIFPECLVPIEVDFMVVDRLSEKHEKH